MDKFHFLKNELNKIANNGESFLGFDGGNINSKIWFCGVEFGSSIEIMNNYYTDFVKFYKSKNFKIPYRVDCPDYFLKSNFDRFLSFMYLNLFSNCNDRNQISNVLKNNLYNKNSNLFKLNLFPLAKKDIGWDKNITDTFKIEKDDYYNFFFKNRSRFVKHLISNYRPDCIICFSPKDYEKYFTEFFIKPKEKVDYSWDKIKLENSEFKISKFESKQIKIVIVPFLGRGNINSFKKVELLTDYLKNNVLQQLV